MVTPLRICVKKGMIIMDLTIEDLWGVISEMRDDIDKLEEKLDEAYEEIESLSSRINDCESNISCRY